MHKNIVFQTGVSDPTFHSNKKQKQKCEKVQEVVCPSKVIAEHMPCLLSQQQTRFKNVVSFLCCPLVAKKMSHGKFNRAIFMIFIQIVMSSVSCCF